MRRSAEGMPTKRNSSITRWRACRGVRPRLLRSPSAICVLTGKTGLSAVIGSWKTMAMRLPRMPRISRADLRKRSSPSKTIVPSRSPPADGNQPHNRAGRHALPTA